MEQVWKQGSIPTWLPSIGKRKACTVSRRPCCNRRDAYKLLERTFKSTSKKTKYRYFGYELKKFSIFVTMKARILLLPLALLLVLAFAQCAKQGRPSGGPLDSIPPKPIRINPENFKTNFTGNTITVQFDEYIRLDKLQENLIISPPMDIPPDIKPHSVSRILEIELRDSLSP